MRQRRSQLWKTRACMKEKYTCVNARDCFNVSRHTCGPNDVGLLLCDNTSATLCELPQKIVPGELPAACLLSSVTHLDTKRSLILYLSVLTLQVDSEANISPETRSYSSGMTYKSTQVLCEEFQEGAVHFHCLKHTQPNGLKLQVSRRHSDSVLPHTYRCTFVHVCAGSQL